jgi:predicted phosphodiesterase
VNAHAKRLAVLADIHGNLPALEAVLAALDGQRLDGYIVAGDLGGGPHTLQVVRRLRSLGAWIVRGNGENDLMAFDRGHASPSRLVARQWAFGRWAYRQLDRPTLDFVASLPDQRVVALPGTAPIRVVHGSLEQPSGRLYPDADPERMDFFYQAGFLARGEQPTPLAPVMAGIAEPVLICGHTHISWQQSDGEWLVVNPGAVCGALEGAPLAHYALLTWQDGCWQAELQAVPYDLALIHAAFVDSGLLSEGGPLARALLHSIESGHEVAWFLLTHARRLAVEAGLPEGDIVPDHIWDQAVATFDWPPQTID